MKFFDLTAEQLAKLEIWTAQQDKAALAEQLGLHDRDPIWAAQNEQGEPYYGPTGGELTFHVTPTSIGSIVKAEHNWTKKLLDLTEYEKF